MNGVIIILIFILCLCFGSAGNRNDRKLVELELQGNLSIFLGYGSNEFPMHSSNIEIHKYHRVPYFRFDKTFSSIISHIIPLLFRNVLGKVKLEVTTKLHLSTSSRPHDINAWLNTTLSLPSRERVHFIQC